MHGQYQQEAPRWNPYQPDLLHSSQYQQTPSQTEQYQHGVEQTNICQQLLPQQTHFQQGALQYSQYQQQALQPDQYQLQYYQNQQTAQLYQEQVQYNQNLQTHQNPYMQQEQQQQQQQQQQYYKQHPQSQRLSNNTDVSSTHTLLCLVNKARSENALHPLAADSQLDYTAHMHSLDQAQRGIMSHTGSDGSTLKERVICNGWYLGRWTSIAENVAMGHADELAVLRGWLTSPGHRKNLLGDFSHMGWSHCADGNVWTQVFAKACDGTVAHVPDARGMPYMDTPVIDIP